MAWEYTEKTKKLFKDAVANKPGTYLGEIEDADGIGNKGSMACGDAIVFYLKVEKDEMNPLNDRIIQVKYKTFGCTSAIASSEALCSIIETQQLTPIEALSITNKDIVEFLDGLPKEKIHCSVMGEEVLESAVKDWAEKRGVDLSPYLRELDKDKCMAGDMICECYDLTDIYIKKKIKEHKLKSVEEITNAIKAGGACGSCVDLDGGLQDMLDEIWKPKSEEIEKAPKKEIPQDLKAQVKRVIEKTIRPMLQLHGGDIELVEVKGTNVYCTLKGACTSCPGAEATLQGVVENNLKELVHSDITIIDI